LRKTSPTSRPPDLSASDGVEVAPRQKADASAGHFPIVDGPARSADDGPLEPSQLCISLQGVDAGATPARDAPGCSCSSSNDLQPLNLASVNAPKLIRWRRAVNNTHLF
jgi:hypothetical protein